MKERPILFKGEMVRAILEGRKTQTRRIVKGKFTALYQNKAYFDKETERWYWQLGDAPNPIDLCIGKCPYGQVGDRLWVKETHATLRDGALVYYRADMKNGYHWLIKKWKPSIFMPRSASRITLEITDIRVERLQEITPSDVIAEGVIEEEGDGLELRDKFEYLWDSINKKTYPWKSNPWIWAKTFKWIKNDK